MNAETKHSRPVDVLAVMEGLADFLSFKCGPSESVEIVSEARAAVAELIEAASRAAIAACRGDDFHPGTIRNADLDALRAALANVGSAS